MNYKPYAEYKDSGIEWIGDIPQGWEVKKLKYIAKSPLLYGANESPDGTEDGQPRYIRITDIDDNGNLRDDTFVSLDIEKARPYLLKKDDILFARSGATVGKSYIYSGENDKACFAGYLIKLSLNPNEAMPKFVYYSTLNRGYKSWIEGSTIQATIQNVSAEKYNNFAVGLPPLLEQAAIADYLDAETAKISSIITTKQKLIEKLQEKRSSIISHAVTKGLDPTAKMKPSGIKWIGDIPEGWVVGALRWHINIKSGDFLDKEHMEVDGDFPIIGGNGIMGFSESVNQITQTIAIGRVGALCGNIHYINYSCWITDNALYLNRYSKKMNLLYYKYLLELLNLNSMASQTAQPLITGELVKKQKVCFPPLPDQIAIANYLDTETAKINDIIAKTKTSIEKLNEYKTALISACVTGKIKVGGQK